MPFKQRDVSFYVAKNWLKTKKATKKTLKNLEKSRFKSILQFLCHIRNISLVLNEFNKQRLIT